MILICAVHVMNTGEMISHAKGGGLLWQYLLYSIFLISVNVFVLISGYFRLYPLNVKKWIIFIVYLICTLSVWGHVYMPQNNFIYKLIYNSLDYTSPLVLIASICALLLFKDIKIKNKFIHASICFVSSCTFGVYLFHTSPIEEYLFFDILHIQNHWGSLYSALWVIVFALAIFAIGFIVDCIRKLLVWIVNIVIKKIRDKRQQNIKNIDINNIYNDKVKGIENL